MLIDFFNCIFAKCAIEFGIDTAIFSILFVLDCKYVSCRCRFGEQAGWFDMTIRFCSGQTGRFNGRVVHVLIRNLKNGNVQRYVVVEVAEKPMLLRVPKVLVTGVS